MYEEFGIDPLGSFTSPGLSWKCFLKTKKHTVENMTDINIYNIINNGIRGGISVISKKYGKANNPYIKGFNPDEPESYIYYLDATNLYGHAMKQKLPTSGGKIVEKTTEQLLSHDCNSNINYVVVCDLDMSDKEMQERTKWYPLCADQLLVNPDMLSQYQRDLMEKFELTKDTVPKLCPNFYNKEKYVCLLNNLQFYVKMGVKITNIHTVVEFTQDYIIRDYIDTNTNKRNKAKKEKNDALSDLFKLLNNALYGYTLMDVTHRANGEIVCDSKRLQKIVNKPTYMNMKKFNDNFAYVTKAKRKIVINEAKQIGFFVLEHSKLHMLNFFYNGLQKTFGVDKVHLLATDTDSLIVQIFSKDVISRFKDGLLGEYIDHHGSGTIGMFKDEIDNDIITEFVGLRSKMYSILTNNEKHKATCKGINRLTKKTINHNLYKQVLFNEQQLQHTQYNLRSINHEINLIEQVKTSLSAFDNKRFNDGNKDFITTPLGYFRNN